MAFNLQKVESEAEPRKDGYDRTIEYAVDLKGRNSISWISFIAVLPMAAKGKQLPGLLKEKAPAILDTLTEVAGQSGNTECNKRLLLIWRQYNKRATIQDLISIVKDLGNTKNVYHKLAERLEEGVDRFQEYGFPIPEPRIYSVEHYKDVQLPHTGRCIWKLNNEIFAVGSESTKGDIKITFVGVDTDLLKQATLKMKETGKFTKITRSGILVKDNLNLIVAGNGNWPGYKVHLCAIDPYDCKIILKRTMINIAGMTPIVCFDHGEEEVGIFYKGKKKICRVVIYNRNNLHRSMSMVSFKYDKSSYEDDICFWNERYLLSSFKNNRIFMYDKSGKKLSSLDKHVESLSKPVSLLPMNEEDIFVLCDTNQVCVYNSTAKTWSIAGGVKTDDNENERGSQKHKSAQKKRRIQFHGALQVLDFLITTTQRSAIINTISED